MSLLLDALKKAAEKNANNGVAAQKQSDATELDASVGTDKTEIADKTAILHETETQENITQYELEQIISAQKAKDSSVNPEPESEALKHSLSAEKEIKPSIEEPEPLAFLSEDKTDINVEKPRVEDLELDVDPSLALIDDEDPSLKLALSDEEILLTDDDVTEFLGTDELNSRLADSSLSLEDETELKLTDRTTTQSLNLVDPPNEYGLGMDDTTTGLGLSSARYDGNQTTNLNSLTNDATLNRQDTTSTQTFASDNYDRTLVKLEDDVSKVFSGMKTEKSGAAMTPDFAKKVFVRKSTSLRRQNYKIYGIISMVVLFAIGLLALFEMQSQIDEIDTGLVWLKQNPVPSALRFKRKEKATENNVVLQGRIDTEAMNLLRSLTQQNNNEEQELSTQTGAVIEQKMPQPPVDKAVVSANKINESAPEPTGKEVPQVDVVEQAMIEVKPEKTVSPKMPVKVVKTNVKAKIKSKKTVIKIETKLAVSKESIWLKDAYQAFENGHLVLAAMNYERVLAKDPSNRDALLGQAAIFAAQNKNTQAINNYQTVLLNNPKDPLALTSLIAASSLSPIESESRLKTLQRESPNATYLQFALGNVISAQNRWKEAQQYYFKAYQSEPNNPDYAYNLAVSLEQVNKPDIAIKYYEQAVTNAQKMHATFDVNVIKQRIEVLSQ